MKHEENLYWLDLLRGVAALLVLMGHLRALMFVEFQRSIGVFGKLFYFITGFGHQSVIIFFVLSGFLIIKSIHTSVLNHRWGFRDYFISRLTRLWVVLLPALIMTAIVDTVGLKYFGQSLAYTGSIPNMEGISPIGKLDLTTFLGNFFFLQTIQVPTFGSNAALWSLANEFWYYVLFPLGYFIFSEFYSLKVKSLFACFFIGILLFVGTEMGVYFLIWLMGGISFWFVKINFIPNPKLRSLFLFVCPILFFATLLFIRLGILPTLFNDFSLAIATALLISALASHTFHSERLKRTAVWLSNISYTLYLTHLSVAVLAVSYFLKTSFQWGLKGLFYYFLILCFVMAYSYLLYFLFERNTPRVKSTVKRIFDLSTKLTSSR